MKTNPEDRAYPESRGARGGLTKREIFFKDILCALSQGSAGQITPDSLVNRAHTITEKAFAKLNEEKAQ